MERVEPAVERALSGPGLMGGFPQGREMAAIAAEVGFRPVEDGQGQGGLGEVEFGGGRVAGGAQIAFDLFGVGEVDPAHLPAS